MKNAFWGYAVMVLGILAIVFIFFFANVTNTDQHNYNLLKETVESAMFDALDLAEYRVNGNIKMDEKKFVESFLRRFAENASLRDSYVIEIYDVSEEPPKVSLKVSTLRGESTDITGDTVTFKADIVNTIDAILETTYSADVLNKEYTEEESDTEEIVGYNPYVPPVQETCTYNYSDYYSVTITCVSPTNYSSCSGSVKLNQSYSDVISIDAPLDCSISGNYLSCQGYKNGNYSVSINYAITGPC